MKKIKCPYCGHEQSVQREQGAVCRGVWMKCKGRHCGREFEIRLPEGEKTSD